MKIENKFDIGQEVWFIDIYHKPLVIYDGIVYAKRFEELIGGYYNWQYVIKSLVGTYLWDDTNLFATREEAEAKLKELRVENVAK